MILLGLHVKPLPPMRDGRQIVIDALAAIKGGVALQAGHVRGLVDWRHPEGNDRACEAIAILAHLCADRNPNGLKEVFESKRRSEKRKADMVDAIIADIRRGKADAHAKGTVFTIAEIKPIIEKALS